jgi:thiol-disulfide isomerase/thioredoxin
MMKRLLLAIGVIATVFTSCDTTPKYAIKGTVKNLDAKKIFLKEYQGRKAVVIDSAEVKDGNFVLEGTIKKTSLCGLFTTKAERSRPFLNLYVENVPFTINFDKKDRMATSIIGGPAQELNNKFTAVDKKLAEDTKPLDAKYQEIRKAISEKKITKEEFDAELNKLREAYAPYGEKANKEKMDLIKANLSSIVAADKFSRAFNDMDFKEAKELANSFTGEAANSETIKKIKEKIVTLDKVAIGQPAPDFTLNTPEGKPLSLSSFKGKVLIVDFWASWCGPCRGENPNVVKMYKKYHKKGLEILSVSLDNNKEAWLKAIKDDGLIWNHVSDLKGWGSAAAKLYGVSGIPHIVLIDKKGTIVAKNLRGKELEAKIREYIK